jgi:hypothetical protein
MSCHSAWITWMRAEQQTDSSLRDEGRVRFRHDRGRIRSAGETPWRLSPPWPGSDVRYIIRTLGWRTGRPAAAIRCGHAGQWPRCRQPLSASRFCRRARLAAPLPDMSHFGPRNFANIAPILLRSYRACATFPKVCPVSGQASCDAARSALGCGVPIKKSREFLQLTTFARR